MAVANATGFISLITKLDPLEIGLLVGALFALTFSKAVHFKALQLVREEFFLASLASGASELKAFLSHGLRNLSEEIARYTSISSAMAVYVEAGLASLGLEAQGTPSLGKEIYLILNTPGALLLFPGQVQLLVLLLTIVVISELVRRLTDEIISRLTLFRKA
jgi:ABC-type dipeptide/oligopeptide/nickel transport system permease subunit